MRTVNGISWTADTEVESQLNTMHSITASGGALDMQQVPLQMSSATAVECTCSPISVSPSYRAGIPSSYHNAADRHSICHLTCAGIVTPPMLCSRRPSRHRVHMLPLVRWPMLHKTLHHRWQGEAARLSMSSRYSNSSLSRIHTGAERRCLRQPITPSESN